VVAVLETLLSSPSIGLMIMMMMIVMTMIMIKMMEKKNRVKKRPP